MGRWPAVSAALLLAGCTSLTPAEEHGLDAVRAFADRTAQVYGLPPIHVLVSHSPESPVGSYRRGFFSVSTPTLDSEFRDAIVAHELAHYVLGHDAPLPGASAAERARARERREMEANATAVEILVRVQGRSEERALGSLYDYLRGVQRARERYPRLDLLGHRPPCEEIADLLGRFPGQRVWPAPLECLFGTAATGG